MAIDEQEEGQSSGNTPTIKAVEASLAIIDALQSIGPATITEVATYIGMSKGGTYKQLKTLKQGQFVVQEGKQYQLGFRYLEIGGYLRNEHPGSGLIKMKMQELAAATGETSIYTVLEDNRTTVLFRETGDRGISMRTRIGDRRPPHITAAGKCLLAQQSREEVEALLGDEPLPQVTDNTITDMDTLWDELVAVRERGYAYNIGESVEGLRAIAAPLMPDGRLLGACSVTGPHHRLKGDPVDEDIKSSLVSFVKELEHNIARSRVL